MTNKKNAKRAFLMSLVALVLCFTMLLGTTYAWFTDSVTSMNNIITSGNLDMELSYKPYGVETDWTEVESDTQVFGKDAHYEPGYTEAVWLKIENVGSLAFRYNLSLNVYSEKEGVNQDGKTFKLSDYLTVKALTTTSTDMETSGFYDTREQLVNNFAWGSAANSVDTDFKSGNVMALDGVAYSKDDSNYADYNTMYVLVVIQMPTAVGNEANHDGETIPEIKFAVNAVATQLPHENDSFDNQYDKDAMVFTVEEANTLLAAGKNVILANCVDVDGVVTMPGNAGVLTLSNVSISSIQATGDAKLVIDGTVSVVATQENTSAITSIGTLTISGSGKLTVEGNGTHAYGIGGDETQAVTISNVHIVSAEGGFVGEIGSDLKYYKDAREGGAAIGSGYDGAIITLKNVIVDSAIGGSKAAGIGASYWTGVTVNISNSIINYVEGGATAAGIGGSRVSLIQDDFGNIVHEEVGEAESVTINIVDSTIIAQGGVYGAGIGSGYDTHCPTYTIVKDCYPVCTINISGNSNITATGGQYAAGVGTGYHNAGLAGTIESGVTVNATSGEKTYKDTYTSAMDIGFGVVDPAREGKENNSSIVYNGETISIPSVTTNP